MREVDPGYNQLDEEYDEDDWDEEGEGASAAAHQVIENAPAEASQQTWVGWLWNLPLVGCCCGGPRQGHAATG
ncbi:unnamed protein product [Vitrella brassicaformis CCMP3155]|uniref:Uncharacterized protein n=1 Tax=Vitrella brassicaformis (strain CCMP3155) TaxID=1169540 RepID=A0A0G4GVR6_VITBC|nr:unnamed protein product [Vitrella brassicaformis CCMP3155]|eukprot:CEM35016.1 unnamed protein product [Vitrella brassicaformis CCMP3155]